MNRFLCVILCLLTVAGHLRAVDKPSVEPLPFQSPPIPSDALFGDTFKSRNGLQQRWIVSKGQKEIDDGDPAPYNGEWGIEMPQEKLLVDDYGLVMKSAARHHAVSAKLSRIFEFSSSSLVVQYDVTFQDMMECGGGYVKLVSHEANIDLNYFNNKTPFTIMFGPDKCGASAKMHLIIRHKSPVTGEILEHAAVPSTSNLLPLFQDKKAHLLTLVLNPDDKYFVYLDQKEIMRGSLMRDLEPPVVPPKEIDDPTDKKPASWDEREKIPDATAVKPDDWDESQPEYVEDLDAVMPSDWLEDEPQFVPDDTATEPDDWDENMDGKWEPSTIANPKCKTVSGCGVWKRPTKKNPLYKGKWKPPMVPNPDYKGKWTPKKVTNPSYFELHNVFETLQPITAVGLELWTITPEVFFDNFLITTNEADAKLFAKQTWQLKKSAESLRDENFGFFRKLIKETESKPWLWAIYAVAILLPIVILGLWCFSPSKKKNANEVTKEEDISQEADYEEEEPIDDSFPTADREEDSLSHSSEDGADDQPDAELADIADDEHVLDRKDSKKLPTHERRSVRRQDD